MGGEPGLDFTRGAAAAVAAALREAAAAVNRAQDQALTARLDPSAYGMLFSFLPDWINPLQDAACEALQEESRALGNSTEALLSAEHIIVTADTDAEATFGALG